MKTYLVCMDSHYVRDAQVFRTENYSEEELNQIDIHSEHEENSWRDAEITPYIDIVQAHDEDEACRMVAQRCRYDEKCLYATDIAGFCGRDEMHTRVKGGYLAATICPDPDYPGIDVEYVADKENDKDLSRPRVLIEYPIDGNLRALVWNNPKDEDYTEEIILKEEAK